MASVIISMGRVVCQLASLRKRWGGRRRQLARPECEKQTHLVKLHPYYLIRWCSEGEGVLSTGLWLCAERAMSAGLCETEIQKK